ncbi:MAG: hypothetical protein ACREVA_07610 [Burkholderiales bacterium]
MNASFGSLLLKVCLVVMILLAAGCAASTVTPADPQVVSERLPFIRDGKTPRKEVLSRLGTPDYRHEGGRILAYKMWMCAMEEERPLIAETRCRDSGTYNLILVFGPNNLVERHSLVRVK